MSPDRWQQIEAVFQSALDLAPDKRELYLAEHCRDDDELRREVAKLLSDYYSADSFIESPVWTDSRFLNSSAKKVLSESFNEDAHNANTDFLNGKRIGVYRLTREIGRGGMGTVFLAERADGEFSQKVAIKLIKRGMDSDFIIRRFRHERQILASFEHPFIARLLDGGTTAENLPYFVMEYIEGDTLYNFCDKKSLNVKERLKIFQKVCSALQYAHENQIIHRDIKPSNILVTRHDVPKLLDFGIAKVLNPDLIHESINPTASIMRLMTPDYASPEQVCGGEVTASSDIYSLGILLYELLTGHRPYNFNGRALHEVSRVICEVAPELPSAIIGKSGNLLPQYAEYSDKFARLRSTEPDALKRELAGNLDNIILKALGKEISDRYDSAQEFSEDISRHLRGESVLAKPFFPKTQTKTLKPLSEIPGKSLAVLPFKFINLNPSDNTGDSFLGLGLTDALIARLSQVRRFVVRPTSSVLQFQDSLSDPIKAGKDLGVDYILDGNIKKANDRLRVTVQLLSVAENATIWATSIDETLADVFALEDTLSNKMIEVLLPQLTGSEREEFSRRGTSNAEAFEKYLRGRYYFNSFTEDGFAKAFISFHEAIAADPEYAHAYAGIADYYNWLGIFGVLPPQDCFQSAISAATKAIELDEELSEGHASLGFSLHAGNYDWSKAEQHLSRALELNPNNATAYVWYSIVLYTEARFTEGLELARRGVELDPLTPFNIHNLGWGFYYARRYEDGINQYKKLIADFSTYGLAYYGLSKIYRITGKTAESVDEIQKAKELFNDSVFSLLSEAESYAADGQRDKAEDKLNKLLELSKTRYVSPYQLSLVYCYLNEKEKALELLEKAFEIKEAWTNWMGVEPAFDPLRSDERFQKILEKTGYHHFFNNFPVSNNDPGKTTDGSKTGDNLKQLSPTTQNYSFHNETTLNLQGLEGTSEGKEKTVSPKRKNSRRKNFSYAAAGVLAVLFGAATGQFYMPNGFFNKTPAETVSANKTFQNPSIVILPFKDDDVSRENVGVGFADALTRKIGNIKRLTVISSSTGRLIADADLPTINKELGLVFVIRGTMTKKGSGINIASEMVNSSTGDVLWSESFSDEKSDLFVLQTKLAEKILASLSIEPLPLEKEQIYRSYTSNLLAYQLFLVGRYQMTNRSPENLRKAINAFSQSLNEDPNFALAHVGLADAYLLLNLYDVEPPPDAYPRAEQAALRAISIDDNLAAAHTSLGYIKFFNKRDRAGAELEFRRAIQINPSYAQAHHWFSLTLSAMKRPTEAISEARTAERLDPLSSAVKTALCAAYYYGKQYEQALATCDKALALNQDFVPAHKTKRWIYLATGEYQPALDSFRKEYSYSGGNNEPGWTIIKSQVEALGSNREKAVLELKQAIEAPEIKNNPFVYAEEIALAFNALGDRENALLWLEKAEAANNHGFNFIFAHPRFENLENEPRFQALLKIVREPKH